MNYCRVMVEMGERTKKRAVFVVFKTKQSKLCTSKEKQKQYITFHYTTISTLRVLNVLIAANSEQWTDSGTDALIFIV